MRESAARAVGGFARTVTGLLALATLAAAVVAWVELSRPFDPGQLTVRTAAAPMLDTVPPAVPQTVTVLTYHGVIDAPTESSAVTRQTFAQHLAALQSAGYRTIRLAQLRDLLAGRQVELPERALLLTFDGGSLTDWTAVDPMLAAAHYTGTAFLSTSRIVAAGTPSSYLSNRQLGELKRTGRWDFGSRSHALDTNQPVAGNIRPALTNRILTGADTESLSAWRERVKADLAATQAYFTANLGGPAYAFAYPFGDDGAESNDPAIPAELPKLLGQAGFSLGFVGENVPTGHIDALDSSSPRYHLQRIGVRTTTSAAGLMDMISRSQPVPPPNQLTALRWAGAHGTRTRCAVSPSAVTVAVQRDGLCEDASVNTTRWSDYTVSSTISGASQRCTAFIALRTGTGTGHHGRIEIALGNSTVAVRQQILNQPRTTLASGVVPAGARRSVRVVIQHRSIRVVVAGAAPVLATIDRRLASGGVAFGVESAGACKAIFADPRLTEIH